MPGIPSIARPVVFPLYGIADGKCACGHEGCTRVGKHPAILWRDVEYGSAVPRPEPGAGAGLRTGVAPHGSNVFVVDLDGEDAVAKWEELGGSNETYTIETGRVGGGWQLYFEPPDFLVKNTVKELWWNGLKGDLSQGIDTRGEGGYVVTAGSPHKSGKTYEVYVDAPIAKAPAWLLDWLRERKPTHTEAQSYPGDVAGAERHHRRGLYAEYLRAEAPPCVQGSAGDDTLFTVVQRGAYDLALPVDDVLELVRDIYDERCEPPWGAELEERVAHKAHQAKTVSTRMRFEPLPSDLTHLGKTTPAELPAFAAPAPIDNSKKPETIGDSPNSKNSAGSLGERWGGWDIALLPPVYILDGLIPEGKVVTFFAEGGSVKTWSALALAIAVASGKPWLARYPVKRGKVLYLDYEDGPYEVARRVRMLTGGENVQDLGYLYGGPNIDDVELWKTLAKKVVTEGISLVVVDSLGAGMPGDADENTTAFAAGMKIAGRFTETGCTVLFVHHANKTGGMRGTSAARDQSDVVFKFESVTETDSIKRMRMVCDKPGPQKRPKPVNVELSDAGLTTFEDEAGDAGRNAKGPQELKAAILLALGTRAMMTTEALHSQFKGSCGEKAVESALRDLKQLGQIVKPGHLGQWQLDDDGRRRARMLAAAPTCRSSAELARDAYVPPECVREALKERVIELRTGHEGGGFIVR